METSEQPRGIRKGLRNTKIKILSSKIHRVAGLPNRSAGHGWKRSGGGNEARARGGASLEIKITPGGKGEDLLRFMKMNGQGHLGGLGD